MDRNLLVVGSLTTLGGSLSARRAWIEIIFMPRENLVNGSLSARRAWIEMERVNSMLTLIQKSLSARRAWIEISGFCWWVEGDNVALRKESVDRNRSSRTYALNR